MTEPFLGEVQILGFGFAPLNWSLANGQLMSIQQSTALYSLYGASFGGDGSRTFGLPNLAARMACGAGQSPGNSPRSLGQPFGAAGIALSGDNMPVHTHGFNDYQPEGAGKLSGVPATGSAVGTTNGVNLFGPQSASASTTMNGAAISLSGSGMTHENQQPSLGLIYAVAMTGVFPAFS